MSLHYELVAVYDQHQYLLLLIAYIAASAKPKYVMLKVMFGYCCLYCGMRKLYYVLPLGYISRSMSSLYNTIFDKIRNDDQSLSPVTPLVSLLFLSFLIP